jgi:hypothetical protein
MAERFTTAILLQWAGDGERRRWEKKSLRIARVHPIARPAAELLPRDRQGKERSDGEIRAAVLDCPSLRQGRQHGSEAEFSFVSR